MLLLRPLIVNALSLVIGMVSSERSDASSSPLALVQRHAAAVHKEDPIFPIDAVFSWVSQPTESEFADLMKVCPKLHEGWMRVRDFDQLRFSLRLIDQNIPWVRQVFLVTNGKVPHWLNTSSEKLQVIDQASLVPKDRRKTVMPIHNSQQVETYLHRIPGLAENFIYFNDDMFVGQKLPWQYFFKVSGKPILYTSTENPDYEADWAKRKEPGSSMGHHMLYPLTISLIEKMQAKWPKTFERISSMHCRTNEMALGPTWLYQWYGLQSGTMAPSPYGGAHAFLHNSGGPEEDQEKFLYVARHWYSQVLKNPPERGCINDNFALNQSLFEMQVADLQDFMEKFSGGKPSRFEIQTAPRPKGVSMLRFKYGENFIQLPLLRQQHAIQM
jgi:hypothetical protein